MRVLLLSVCLLIISNVNGRNNVSQHEDLLETETEITNELPEKDNVTTEIVKAEQEPNLTQETSGDKKEAEASASSDLDRMVTAGSAKAVEEAKLNLNGAKLNNGANAINNAKKPEFSKVQDKYETNFDASGIVVKMNSAIDLVLDGYRWIYSKDNAITTKLPKIDKYFGKGVYRGKFKAENGYFTNLATLHRTGDVDFFKLGSSVGINASMGLTVAEAGYKNYSLNILEINQYGDIKVDIGHTSLSLSITLTYSPKCKFTLDYVHFDQLSDISVHITGLGAFQLMFEQLSTWLISNFEPSLKTLVNQKLYHELNKVLKDKDICKYVPSF